jgi:WD40 repeat protein
MLAGSLTAQAAVHDTSLASRATGAAGAAGNGDSDGPVAISNSGRYVAFVSEAGNLAPGAEPGVRNVFRRDTVTNETILISRATGADGAGANADSTSPALSLGGRFVAFESGADNLSDEDDDAFTNIFVRDTKNGTTILASRAEGAGGAAADGDSHNPSLSSHGNLIAFDSDASNLVEDANPSVRDVFIRSLKDQTVSLVSRSPNGVPGDGDSSNPSISSTGEWTAFQSDADNLSDNDVAGVTDIYLRDRFFASTDLVSCASGNFLIICVPPGDAGNGDSRNPSISPDGRFVAFESDATNISKDDDDTVTDVFLRDAQAYTTTFVSRATGQAGPGGDGASFSPTVSGEGSGQFVAFASAAENLSEVDVGTYDVFVRDTFNYLTTLASRAGGENGAAAAGSSLQPALSGDGRAVAFASEADNLSNQDSDAFWNLFTRELSLTPPPPPPPIIEPACHHGVCEPGDTGAHVDHGAAGHAGHSAAGGHGGHDATSPTQTLFAPGRQSLAKLFVMVQVHEKSTVQVKGTVSVPGISKSFRFKTVKRRIPLHGVRKIKLRLSAAAARVVKRALRRGKTVRAKVTAIAVDDAGNRGVARRSIKLKP